MTFHENRFQKQTVLREVGPEGQEILSKARVVCVGAGGLGSPVLLYLAAAGVGTLGIIDGDKVDESNLQRQILFPNSVVGEFKAYAAEKNIKLQNPNISCFSYAFHLTAANAREIVSQYDLVIDGTDNFEAKFLINDICAALEIPWVYGSVNQWEGQVASFYSKEGPCYRCLYPKPPAVAIGNCAENGVMGPTVGIIGSWQALLVLQILLPKTSSRFGSLQVINTLSGDQLKIQITKNPKCSVCSLPPQDIRIQDLQGETCVTSSHHLLPAKDVLEKPEHYQPLDVRTLKEWNTGHLPNAQHWPLAEIEKGNLPADLIKELALKNKELLVYCQGGKRSALAVTILKKAGYTDVVELKDGIASWPQSAWPLSHSLSPSS